MFEVRNETEIWYKAKEMPDWIHYGSAVVAEPIEKEKFAVKRFARAALIISAQANGLILSDLNGRLRRHLDG